MKRRSLIVCLLAGCQSPGDLFCDVARCPPGTRCDSETAACRPAPAEARLLAGTVHLFDEGEEMSRCGAAARAAAHSEWSGDARPCPQCHASGADAD